MWKKIEPSGNRQKGTKIPSGNRQKGTKIPSGNRQNIDKPR